MPRGFLGKGKKIFKKSKKDDENVLTKAKQCAIISRSQDDLGVAQLVARYLGVVEAASSSLVTQTKHDSVEPKGKQGRVFLLCTRYVHCCWNDF